MRAALILLCQAPPLLAYAGSTAYPTDCRNQTWTIDGGKLEVSGHFLSFPMHGNSL